MRFERCRGWGNDGVKKENIFTVEEPSAVGSLPRYPIKCSDDLNVRTISRNID